MLNPLKIAVAGSTTHTKNSAEVLANHPDFEISWILTPEPKKIGREQKITTNPLHEWAKNQQIPCFLVKDKIDKQLREQIVNPPDYLLAVDFGYFIPNWLIELPKKMPLNLHPSALPAWRGSSPGQFLLLSGAEKSAISLIQLTNKLDAGPIVQQAEFMIDHTWNAEEYYQQSFSLVNKFLPDWILAFDQGKLKTKPQPIQSPTTEARRIKKKDAWLDWKILQFLIEGSYQQLEKIQHSLETKTILNQQLKKEVLSNWPDVIERASRAFQPWPILWTTIPTTKREKRMQILSCQETEDKKLQLNQVKIEGQTVKPWDEVKNQVKSEK